MKQRKSPAASAFFSHLPAGFFGRFAISSSWKGGAPLRPALPPRLMLRESHAPSCGVARCDGASTWECTLFARPRFLFKSEG
ncbi:MAG TPA: hypothetical protein VKZ48_03735 [Burkholderiales bacterium]|nr:hypothetical protein [Burkholderiales bacterium]